MKIRTALGCSSFEELRKDARVYIDKTAFIARLLRVYDASLPYGGAAPKVSLITRPRRFGKTLLLSTLEAFFDISKDSASLFEGLEITRYRALCLNWMNQYPVIVISFRGMIKHTYSENLNEFYQNVVIPLLERNQDSLCDPGLFIVYREYFDSLIRMGGLPYSERAYEELRFFLKNLLHALYSYYGKKVIVLIDEYDVPLASAQKHAFYDSMLSFMRSLLSCLKDNQELNFAVLTGCLRLSKESMFTGLNNFNCNSVYDTEYADSFGFTRQDVKYLLKLYHLEEKEELLVKWYDGYRFGKMTDMFCPWDVLSYLEEAQQDPALHPKLYWANTGSAEVLSQFIKKYYFELQGEIENLFAGGSVFAAYDEKITYNTLYDAVNNFWMLLYFTGYLTRSRADSETGEASLSLGFPNLEIREIFASLIAEVNAELYASRDLSALFKAFFSGDAYAIGHCLSELLLDTISYHDYREDFYHAFVAGLWSARYAVKSNREYGLGRPDLLYINREAKQALIIECKVAANEAELTDKARDALRQTEVKQYAAELMQKYAITRIGLAFFRKSCVAVCAKSSMGGLN